MNLTIHNVAKIAEADLRFDGITMIVGDNNTGKTTVGRVLFSVYNSLVEIESRMKELRQRECSLAFRQFVDGSRDLSFMRTLGQLLDEFLAHPENDGAAIQAALLRVVSSRLEQDAITEAIGQAKKIRSLSDAQFRDRVVYNYFRFAFNGHHMPIPPASGPTTIDAEVGGKAIRIGLSDNSASCQVETNILHRAFFIDSPDLLRNVTTGFHRDVAGCGLGYSLVSAMIEKVRSLDRPEDSAISDLLFEERLSRLCQHISGIIKGDVVFSRGEGVRFLDKSQEGGGRFDLRNVSQGQKSFGLILFALSLGVIRPKDVLILDEPEIHLHPEWELFYAELVVLLRKEFELTILLTTHSPTFMRAVQLYSLEHELAVTDLHVYRSVLRKDNKVDILTAESSEWDSVYLSFLNASYILQDLADKHADQLSAFDGEEKESEDECD